VFACFVFVRAPVLLCVERVCLHEACCRTCMTACDKMRASHNSACTCVCASLSVCAHMCTCACMCYVCTQKHTCQRGSQGCNSLVGRDALSSCSPFIHSPTHPTTLMYTPTPTYPSTHTHPYPGLFSSIFWEQGFDKVRESSRTL